MEKNFFDQPLKDNKVTYVNIRKITTAQGDDYTTGCLLDYNYFKKYYKMIAVDLSKQQATKNETEVVLRLSCNMIGDNETNFPHKVLLTNRQVSNLRKAFANHLSTDTKLSKTQLSNMIQ